MKKFKKRVLIIIPIILLLVYFLNLISTGSSGTFDIVDIELSEKAKLKSETLGIGGGGMLFCPSFSPFDDNTFMVTSDMGGLYVTHDAGENWTRKNLKGVVLKTYFDPNKEGILYAGGTGLYRSTDNGENFELIFPKEEDIIERRQNEESTMQYLFASGNYPTDKFVKEILVNPKDSNNIFVVMYFEKEDIVFESKDNGETFEEIFSYTRTKYKNDVFNEVCKLFYKSETDELYYAVEDGIYKYDGTLSPVYESTLGIVDLTKIEDNGTKFIIIEKTAEIENCETKVFYTSNFNETFDITEKIIKDIPNSFDSSIYIETGEYGTVNFKWNFTFIDATFLNNIYVAQENMASNCSYPYYIAGIIKYNGKKSTWLYGHPWKDNFIDLESRSWNEGNTKAYGLVVSDKNPSSFLYTTLHAIYYSPDSKTMYQRCCKVTQDELGTRYSTNGIDVQTTYGIRINPFDENNILLLNTDNGLIRSTDSGKTWVQSNSGIKSEWINTVYDLEFDKNKENIVYSIWSGRHDAPYKLIKENEKIYGGFAISTDGGKTWDSNYSSGLPENAMPVKMAVYYPENEDEVYIYLATFNEGFFVSYDSGKTFTSLNDGLSRIENCNFIVGTDIEVKDGRIFGLTGKSYYNNTVQKGEVFELKDNKWKKIDLGEKVAIPRDIYYKDETLYITATTYPTYDYKVSGVDFSECGGGIYTYKSGKVTQIFDEEISVAGVQIDSKGTLYASDINGNIYRKNQNSSTYVRIYSDFHSISKGIQLINDDTIIMSTFGGGILKLEGVSKLSDTNTADFAEIDEDNSEGTSYWKKIPIVSKELLEKEEVTIGGEGCQWPLCMASSSDGKYLFYGTDVAGIYRSIDNGKTWDLSIKNYTAGGASDIVVDPNNSERVIAFGVNSTAEYTTGIHLSEDGGETWSFKQNFMISGYRDVSENIAYDASSYDEKLGYSKIAYVSLIYEKDIEGRNGLEIVDTVSDDYTDGKSKCNKAGLYKTEDGGNTWNMVSNTLYDGIVKVNPKSGTVYVAKSDGLYKSSDEGKTFNKINSESIFGLDIIENENIVKIYYSTNDGIFYTENDGESFSKVESTNFPSKTNSFPQNIKVSPVNTNNIIMYFGEEIIKNNVYNPKGDIYYSQNGGKTWAKSTYDDSYNFMYYIFERVPNFVWSSTDENRVWTFTSDWISSSYNAGKQFRWDANGVNAMLVGGKWHFNIYNSNIIYMSSQDYNGVVTLDGGATWKRVDLYTNSKHNWANNGFIYGGYAADELTYFGGASEGWTTKRYLTITHDGGKTHTNYMGDENYALSGGKDNRLEGQANYSSYQSAKNPKILFCGDLRSTDGGYNWERMVDENGEVAVTGVYTHDTKTGRLFGINDYIGWVVYSDDDGESWHKYNKESLNKFWDSLYIEYLAYDSSNDRLYVAWGWSQLSVITDGGKKVINLTSNLPKMLQFEGAPTKEQMEGNYAETRIATVAVDPNNPSIIYAGGYCYTYRGDCSVYRSCDGGKTWRVVSINGSNSIVSTENGDYGGVEATCMNVNPETGELWVSGSCTGLSKLTPPYKKNNNLLGDIDLDGRITVNDLAILKLHYIGKQILEHNRLEIADIDEDGEITVNDIAKLKLLLIE